MSWLIREFKICVSLISGIKTQFLFFSGRLFVTYLTKIWGNACTDVHKIDTNVTINIKNSTNITIIWGNICKNVHKINTNFTLNFKSSKISTLSWTLKFLNFKRLHVNYFENLFGESYKQGLYITDFTVLFTLPTKFLVINISGKLAPSSFHAKCGKCSHNNVCYKEFG